MYKKRVYFNELVSLFLTRGAKIGKTLTFQAIVEGLLQMHHKDLKSNHSKTKALLMAFTMKFAFNIGGNIENSTLHIYVDQSYFNLEKLSVETLNKLINQYEKLQFIVLDEVSLVRIRMLNAIDHRLQSIKHVQNNFFGGLDVIVSRVFYQTPPIRDKWVSKKLMKTLML
jgi:hypothetical protein